MTPVPNELFDVHLPHLKPGELKVLLVVVRQTLGFVKHKGSKERKTRDWISRSQLVQKTGCSKMTVSQSIASLVQKRLIAVVDRSGRPLSRPQDRKGKSRLYFQLTLRHRFSRQSRTRGTKRINNLLNNQLYGTHQSQKYS